MSVDLAEEKNGQVGQLYDIIEKQNELISSYNQQLSEFKLYISNFIVKVFDLSLVCRQNLLNLKEGDMKTELKNKNN